MNALVAALSLSVACAVAAEPPPAQPPPGKIRVLLVTGVDHPIHQWKETAPALAEVLKADKRMEVETVENPNVLASEKPFSFDVLLLHFKNHEPLDDDEQARKNLTRFVHDGKGLVLVHFACGAFEDWPEFDDLVGRVWDKKNGQDRRRRFTVRIADKEHEITRGLKDFETDDELYTCLTGDKEIRVLAQAVSRSTGKPHPMALVTESGKGRVFLTTLGHDVKAIRTPEFGEFLRRGAAWSAGKPVVATQPEAKPPVGK
jgi:type 1 glutamine amidotransferase